MKPIKITHEDDSQLELFKSQKDFPLRREGLMLVDTARVVDRLLAAKIPIKALLGPAEYLQQVISEGKVGPDVTLLECGTKVLEAIYGYPIHSGVIALAHRPKDTELSQLDDTILFLNGVNNAENVGALVRNCLAFNARSICIDPQSCSPFVRRSIRVSMGSIFKCKTHHCHDLTASLQALKSLGYKIFAAHLSPRSQELKTISFPKKSVLLLGCEGEGISPHALQQVDQEVFIPMDKGIDSLNVAVAGGIFLHHMVDYRYIDSQSMYS